MIKEELFWKNPHYQKKPSLSTDIECQFLIVGGGVAGVSLAYFLNKMGAKDIVLIEKNEIATGATGRAAGMLIHEEEGALLQDIFKELGEHKTLVLLHAQLAALNRIKHIILDEKIECDFQEKPYLLLSTATMNYRRVMEEYQIHNELHQRVRMVLEPELEKKLHSPVFEFGLLVPQGVSINPLMYSQNLSNFLVQQGVKIFEHSPLLKMQGNVAETPQGKIKFKHVIQATDSFSGHKDVECLRTTIVVTNKLSETELEKASMLKQSMFEDISEADHYAKLTKDGRLLVGYGNIEVSTGAEREMLCKEHVQGLEKFIKRVFPELGLNIEYAWSGVMGKSKKLLPIIEWNKNETKILGGGTQAVSTMLAHYVAGHLMGKKQALDEIFC